MSTCLVITAETSFSGMVALAKTLGDTHAVVVGTPALAKSVAESGVQSVYFVETSLPESKASIVAQCVSSLNPNVVLTTTAPGARVLAGAIAHKMDAVVVLGVTSIALEGDTVIVEQIALGGRVLETLVSKKPVVGFFVGDDSELNATSSIEIKSLDGDGYEMSLNVTSIGAGSSGLADAARVVSIGRGVKAKEDIALIKSLANSMDAKLACSMPVADDLGWLPKECYIGRSGQAISPRVYFAVGISGAPQHLEGVRRAKITVAINNDPEARIFRSVDYGIVGDLYEIIPALTKVLN